MMVVLLRWISIWGLSIQVVTRFFRPVVDGRTFFIGFIFRGLCRKEKKLKEDFFHV